MFLYANQSFAERFGYQETDDIISIPVIDIIAAADQEKYKSFMKTFKFSEEDKQELTLTGTRADGSSFNIDIAVTHAVYENDPCTQLLVAAQIGLDSAAVAAEIKKASNLDPLTGIYNRVYMNSALDQAVHNASEKDKFSSLHIIGIDLYDEMRTSLGASARDSATKDLADFIKSTLGGNGTLGRIADSEFAWLTSGTDEDQQTQQAKTLCQKIAAHICQAGDKTTQVTVSIGICPITEKITNPDQVLDRAHTACDEVRSAGKNGTGNDARYFIAKLGDADAEKDDSLIT